MHRAASGLLLAVLVASVALAVTSLPPAPSAFPVRANAVNLALNYSDPAGDVFELYTSNSSHVTNAAGGWLTFGTPMSVDLQRVASKDLGTAVDILLKVRATVAVLPNTTYEYRLYTRLDNSTHYIVTFHDGYTNLRSNHSGSQVVNLTANATVGGQTSLGWLGVVVSKADLGGVANITKWDMDAQAKMVGTNYTYVDYVWSLPGNPASAPAAIQGHVTDAGTGAPLENVNVSVQTFYTHTNATGYYLLPATYGNLSLSFALSGYASQSKSVTVANQTTATVNAALTRVVPLTEQPIFWALIVVAVVAVVAVAFLLLRRRSKPKTPEKPQ